MAVQEVVTREYTINMHKRVCLHNHTTTCDFNPAQSVGYCKF